MHNRALFWITVCIFLIHNVVPLHQLDALLGEPEGAGRAIVRTGQFLAGVVREALRPCHRQQVRALFEVGIVPLQILALGEYRAQNAAFFTGATGLYGIQRDGGGIWRRVRSLEPYTPPQRLSCNSGSTSMLPSHGAGRSNSMPR